MNTDDPAVLTQAEALVTQIDEARGRAAWAEANGLLKQALDLVGNRYHREDTIDETGMRLVLADAQEKAGALETAAGIRKKMLDARLLMLRSKLDASKVTPAPGR